MAQTDGDKVVKPQDGSHPNPVPQNLTAPESSLLENASTGIATQNQVASHPIVPPHSPPHRRHHGTGVGSPLYNPRIRSQSAGQEPLFPYPSSPYVTRSTPTSPISQARAALMTVPAMPFLPHEHSAQRKAMESAIMAERKRAKELEINELNLNADEMRAVLKRERHRMGRIAGELAALKAASAQSQLEAEVTEEGRINTLMRRMDHLKRDKGRIIVELENEEERVRDVMMKSALNWSAAVVLHQNPTMSKVDLFFIYFL